MKGSLRKPRSAAGSWAYRIDGLVGAGQGRRQIQVGGFATEADAGRPNHPQPVRARFASACAKAGVRRIRLHDPRHTSASMALAAGIHQKIVQERSEHTSVKMTLDVYSHVGKNLQDASAGELYRSMSAGVPVGDRSEPPIGESLEESRPRCAQRPGPLRVRFAIRRRSTTSDRVFVAAINEA